MIEAALFTLLSGDVGVSALVGARIYPDALPQDSEYPALVYFLDKTGFSYVFGAEAPNNVDNSFSVDCWAKSAAVAADLITAIKAVLQHQAVTVDDKTILASTLTSERADYDEQAEAFKSTVFFKLLNEDYVAPVAAPFSDSFTDANNTPLTSHVSDSGHSWEFLSGSNGTVIDPGRLLLDFNTLASPVDNFLGYTDGVFVATFYFIIWATFARIYFRWQDASNYYYVQISDKGRFWLYRVVGGTPTQLDYTDTGVLFKSRGETIKVSFTGDQITIIRQEGQPDEIVLGPFTDPSPFYGGSRIAVYAISGGVNQLKWDDMSYVPSA